MWWNQFNQAVNPKSHIYEPLQPISKRLAIGYRRQAALYDQNNRCNIIRIGYPKGGSFPGPHFGLLFCKFLDVLCTNITPIDDNYIGTAAGNI